MITIIVGVTALPHQGSVTLADRGRLKIRLYKKNALHD